jgi:hypothetical protein
MMGERAPRPTAGRDRLRGRGHERETVVLVDDMIDTAGTLCAPAKTVLEEGAARVIAYATHGVFSGEALDIREGRASAHTTAGRCGSLRSDCHGHLRGTNVSKFATITLRLPSSSPITARGLGCGVDVRVPQG